MESDCGLGYGRLASIAYVTFLPCSTQNLFAKGELTLIAGFIRRIQVTANGNGWDHVYDLSYFFGFFVSGLTHWILHTIFPTEKQRGSSPFEMDLHRSMAVEGEVPMGYRGSLESGSKEVVKSDV